MKLAINTFLVSAQSFFGCFGVKVRAALVVPVLLASGVFVSFTGVSSVQAAIVPTVNLGSASSFAVLAQTYVITGAPSKFYGDIGAGGAVTTGADNDIK